MPADVAELLREAIRTHVANARVALADGDRRAFNQHYRKAEERLAELGEALEDEERRRRRERA